MRQSFTTYQLHVVKAVLRDGAASCRRVRSSSRRLGFHIAATGLRELQEASLYQPNPNITPTADLAQTTLDLQWPPAPELLAGCEPQAAPLDVAVLLSGGVDSSLALRLLLAAGHRVSAFYLQIWFQEDFSNYWDACPWEEDLSYCREVCEAAGVTLEVVPLTQQYWDLVVAHSIREIRAGRTPNPDILCNSWVKFGAFYEHLASRQRFDRVASGHYARLLRSVDPAAPVQLALGPDAVKDQTYFLAHLTQQQLERTMFPLGALTKAQVRSLAAAAELPNGGRRDSQGICFLGKVQFGDFVKRHLGTWPGPIIQAETNAVLGFHEGVWFHTLGQRKGIHLGGGPWYVVRKDPKRNAVYVSNDYHSGSMQRNSFSCTSFNWIAGQPQLGKPLHCKVRHGPQLYHCSFEWLPGSGEARAKITLPSDDQGLAAGQSAVFYQDGVCLGSGIIECSRTQL